MGKLVSDSSSKYIDAINSVLSQKKIIRSIHQEVSVKDMSKYISKDDISTLESFFYSGVDSLNTFELILCIDKECAIKILERSYMGVVVDPDTKGGGFESELGIMLSDIVDIYGEEYLLKFISSEKVSSKKLLDTRVINAICFALDITEKEYKKTFIKK